MLAKQYSHRLPADYDMGVIRHRAADRGPLWDEVDGLLFKVFAGQERGVHGARHNLYASIYLWADPAGAARFLMGSGFDSVIDSFGRPHIESWLPLDWRRGRANQARTLYRESLAIDPLADRARLLAEQVEHNQRLADDPDTFAVFVALDLQAWELVRFTLSASAPDSARGAERYEVLYLARPGIASA
ncbi:DUF4865 family protein [Pseudomonas chlororaphis]|uniref:DUF4865 family protein n=1 Tax=Pseudomonas chlororaphis TaxID=587753 RepID=UPI0006A5F6B8|nr:DUF4865 family protein [Pseudomonas chlororaphis]AZD01477.1 hypothetical protein C4K27_2283 [Pseudomonas chlororaphis subsp. chlororaphis]MBM0285159.1 DUF4865 family protein [Pseudomonas chlororaphis]MDO1505831.1 DUF4865 family protein [Pseudomonas chlororaphis]ORM49709.1 DUF4865 domain-containing protein [Pseudomonas chlororaphis subsp. chlororaphis]TWR98987.1 DUF4865 family protein [Pseudomonas chlororaphis subsp. chlororaphis]